MKYRRLTPEQELISEKAWRKITNQKNPSGLSFTIMKALFSVAAFLCLTLFIPISGCGNRNNHHIKSNEINSKAIYSKNPQADDTSHTENQKVELTKFYTQAIGDYIRLVKEEYNLSFDTLFFGKHKNDQETDFPDINLPGEIENTKIKVISPEKGEEQQNKNSSSFYINLFSWVSTDQASFTFVTFSNGFVHQFDCFIEYKYDNDQKLFAIQTTKFKNYGYKKKR